MGVAFLAGSAAAILAFLVYGDVREGMIPLLTLVQVTIKQSVQLIAFASVLFYLSWRAFLMLAAIIPISAAVGALLGKIGNGKPFAIGTQSQPLTMPASGRLMLGVNDNELGDNSGSFKVIVAKQQ